MTRDPGTAPEGSGPVLSNQLETWPMELGRLHAETPTGTTISLPLPGAWPRQRIIDLLIGAGFDDVAVAPRSDAGDDATTRPLLTARRALSLPDSVGPGMEILFCGLNPSLHAARAGVGYIGHGNRFWPALATVGLVTRQRDPWHALTEDRLGMTDLVKRSSRRAAEIDRAEFEAGADRLERLVGWLQPAVVCVVGLSGWRAVVDRSARAGPGGTLGGRPVYVMPSTSGLNTHTSMDDLVDHMRAAAALGRPVP